MERTARIESEPFRWTSASRSHAGLVREVNEDACLDQPEHRVWAVADGMGGHALGEFASRLAVNSLNDMAASQSLEECVADARERLQDANRRLRAEAAMRDVPLIGTTIVALLATGRRCAFLWAGDSRLYLCRAGRLSLLTRDHSEIEAARTAPAASHANPDATLERPPANLITRALGAVDIVDIDVATLDVRDGDVFLLCSDGLSNEVGEGAIERALLPASCAQACEVLVDLALEAGGRDNISAVVIRADDLHSPDRTDMHPVM
jgi:protein phosphatase